jgi:hypothetical protein
VVPEKRNEEIALMAILFRILFALGLLIPHVSVLSGKYEKKQSHNYFRGMELVKKFLLCLCFDKWIFAYQSLAFLFRCCEGEEWSGGEKFAAFCENRSLFSGEP